MVKKFNKMTLDIELTKKRSSTQSPYPSPRFGGFGAQKDMEDY